MTSRMTGSLVAAAAAVAVGSCGDGSEVSPQGFQTEANRVCRDVERELDSIQRMPPRTADQAEEQAEAILDVSDQALDNLRKIDPPEELEQTYERYLSAREEAIGFIEDAREGAADNDSQAYVRAKRDLADGQPTRRQLALELKLGACSRPSLPSR
jgi:hypothetical protein